MGQNIEAVKGSSIFRKSYSIKSHLEVKMKHMKIEIQYKTQKKRKKKRKKTLLTEKKENSPNLESV